MHALNNRKTFFQVCIIKTKHIWSYHRETTNKVLSFFLSSFVSCHTLVKFILLLDYSLAALGFLLSLPSPTLF